MVDSWERKFNFIFRTTSFNIFLFLEEIHWIIVWTNLQTILYFTNVHRVFEIETQLKKLIPRWKVPFFFRGIRTSGYVSQISGYAGVRWEKKSNSMRCWLQFTHWFWSAGSQRWCKNFLTSFVTGKENGTSFLIVRPRIELLSVRQHVVAITQMRADISHGS